MTWFAVTGLIASLVLASPARAQAGGRPLCEIGSSVAELLHFEYTIPSDPVTHGPINPTDLRSSIIFLAECPSDMAPALKTFPEEPELRRAWIEAVRSASQDSSNHDVRAFLGVARARVARLKNRPLDKYLDGIFDGLAPSPLDERALEPLFERQALATLRLHAGCNGAACFNWSDNILFLLGTHPTAVLRAMRADSASARDWLHSLADDSFSGTPERRGRRDAARREVLAMLARISSPGFEREQRACEDALRAIRFRVIE